MRAMQYEEALLYIHHVSWTRSRLGLTRTFALLGRIGNPQKSLRFIHVAGTNGKGSTAAMLAQIFQSAGYRTGMYTSPYIDRFNERMQVDGHPISDEELADITAYIRPFADEMEDHPTEFELVTAIGFSYFQRHGCQIVVLEVGMGGELDSTNVIDAPELAIITNMGFDHTKELGPTMRDIARAKAGIIKEGGTVVTYGCNPEADAVFEEACRARGAELVVTDHGRIQNLRPALDHLTFDFDGEKDLRCSLIGGYQAHNAAVALTAVEQLRNKGWRIDSAAVRSGLAGVRWPARFEVLCQSPLFIADGGHNPQGVEAAVASLRMHFPGKKLIFLLGIMADKDIPRMLEKIGPVAERFFTVTPCNPRAMQAMELASRLQALGYAAIACETVEDGVQAAIAAAGEDGLICALGSLYMLGDVRSCLRQRTQA